MNDINQKALKMLDVEIDKIQLDLDYFPGTEENQQGLQDAKEVLYYLRTLVEEKINNQPSESK